MKCERVVLFLVLCVLMFMRKRGHRVCLVGRIGHRSALVAPIVTGTTIPPGWSWERVNDDDAKAYKRAFGKNIAVGSYTSPVFDQHIANWCGCCYLVAVVQMIQDRMHLALGLNDTTSTMFPCFQFNMQLALDSYNAHERAIRGDSWNACTGGMPSRVIDAIRSNKCVLRLMADATIWMGHPCTIDMANVSNNENVSVEEVETLPSHPDGIQRRLFKYGPIVLGIDSLCLRDPKLGARGGRVDGATVGNRDHAVTVVGWRVIDGVSHWIVRNSWGIDNVPSARPDPKCVGDDFNTCKVEMEPWTGDPEHRGHAYVPFDHPTLRGPPAPWYDAIPAILRQMLPRTEEEENDSVHARTFTNIRGGLTT